MEKAYQNPEFLASREARTLRILSEYLEPQARFARRSLTCDLRKSRTSRRCWKNGGRSCHG